MTDEFVRRKFKLAIDKLYREDFSLIERKCSERSIVFRLGLYLAKELEGMDVDVDCEYNRNGKSPKLLMGRRYNFPDILLHKRDENNYNYLIGEVKTANDTNIEHFSNDKKKIEGFISESPYFYKQGVHVFISKTKCRIVWYLSERITYCAYCVSEGDHHLHCEFLNTRETRCAFDKWYIDNFDAMVN